MWVVLVLTMVRSRPHHLKHQWSQINTFVSLKHIRHHTYLKSSYVHIQVLHILHHRTMKLLLAFKSFIPRRPIVEIDSKKWFAVGCLIRQWKLFRSYFAAANTFCASKCYFIADNSISAASHKFAAKNTTSVANHNFTIEHTIRQLILICYRQLSFDSESHSMQPT